MNQFKNRKTILIVIGVVILIGAMAITIFSLNETQDIRQRAASNDNPQSPGLNPPQSPTTAQQATNTPLSPTITPKEDQYTGPNDIVQPSVAFENVDTHTQVKANAELILSATAHDDIGVGNVEFLVNGTLICSSAAPYTCSWNVPEPVNTQFVLTVRAYDRTGNVASKSIVVNSY